jgi:hypothetical protein
VTARSPATRRLAKKMPLHGQQAHPQDAAGGRAPTTDVTPRVDRSQRIAHIWEQRASLLSAHRKRVGREAADGIRNHLRLEELVVAPRCGAGLCVEQDYEFGGDVAVCLARCARHADCRDGYACEEVAEAGAGKGSTALVCRPQASQP